MGLGERVCQPLFKKVCARALLHKSLSPPSQPFNFYQLLSNNSANMTQLTQAMALLTAVFDRYANQDGDSKSLTKKELGDLLRHELPGAEPSCKSEADKFFSMLDDDGDGVVTFPEYVTFVATLTLICKRA